MCVSVDPPDFQIISESFEKNEVEEKEGISKKNPNKTLVGHQCISKQPCLVVRLTEGITKERGILLHL